MAEFRQQDKLEIYFTPEQKLRLKQAAFQSSLDVKKKYRSGWTPAQGNISAVVRRAVDEYLDPERIEIPSSIPLTQRSCWATFQTMLCLKNNFDNIANRERAADIMDIFDELMDRGHCWELPSISREAEKTGVRHKKYRFHTRNVVESAAHRKEKERLGEHGNEEHPEEERGEKSARSRLLGPTNVDALGIPKGVKLPAELETEMLRERIRIIEARKKRETG